MAEARYAHFNILTQEILHTTLEGPFLEIVLSRSSIAAAFAQGTRQTVQ